MRPLTHQDIRDHNNWVNRKNRQVKPKPFSGPPLTVSGTGRIKAMPQIAVITGLIKTEAGRDDEAVDKSAKIINAVQIALKDTDADLNFTNIYAGEKRDEDCQKHNEEVLSRHYEIIADNQYNANIKRQLERGVNTSAKPRLPKARMTSKLCPVLNTETQIRFALRIEPAGKAADIIKTLTDAGVDEVDLYGYDFSDYDVLYKQAAAKAVDDAREKAQMIARRAGTDLSEITDFVVDPPERTSRFGPQAMIITNHGNRNVAAGQYSNNDTVISPQSVEYVNVPPIFETVTETIVVQEASTELVTIPAIFETITETVVVQPQYARGDGTIEPAITKPVTRRVVKTPARTMERVIPAVTKQETRRVIKTPASTQERIISAVTVKSSTNALKMSLAGAQTITVKARLTYRYTTPIDGTLPKPETQK